MCSRRCATGGFNVGGEQSGHIILTDHGKTGDGLVAALQVLAELVLAEQAGERAADPVRAAAAAAQECPLRRRRAARGGESVKAAIAAGETRLGATGRLVIRKSGTEPLIRVMAEGEDEALVGEVVETICEAVRTA